MFMYKKIIFALVVFVLFSLYIPNHFADSIREGYKRVSYCIKFDNLSEYPDYDFFAVCDTAMNDIYQMTNPDGCYSMYKFCNFKVCSTKKENSSILNQFIFNQANIDQINFDISAIEVIKNSKEFSCKEIDFKPPGDVKESDSLTKVVDVMSLPNFSDAESTFTKIKVIYTYANETIEEKPYLNNTRPIPSNNMNKKYYWILGISLIALLIILAIFIIRKHKKKK